MNAFEVLWPIFFLRASHFFEEISLRGGGRLPSENAPQPAAKETSMRFASAMSGIIAIALCNHQSWSDILVLLASFHGYIPFSTFFLKKWRFGIPLNE